MKKILLVAVAMVGVLVMLAGCEAANARTAANMSNNAANRLEATVKKLETLEDTDYKFPSAFGTNFFSACEGDQCTAPVQGTAESSQQRSGTRSTTGVRTKPGTLRSNISRKVGGRYSSKHFEMSSINENNAARNSYYDKVDDLYVMCADISAANKKCNEKVAELKAQTKALKDLSLELKNSNTRNNFTNFNKQYQKLDKDIGRLYKDRGTVKLAAKNLPKKSDTLSVDNSTLRYSGMLKKVDHRLNLLNNTTKNLSELNQSIRTLTNNNASNNTDTTSEQKNSQSGMTSKFRKSQINRNQSSGPIRNIKKNEESPMTRQITPLNRRVMRNRINRSRADKPELNDNVISQDNNVTTPDNITQNNNVTSKNAQDNNVAPQNRTPRRRTPGNRDIPATIPHASNRRATRAPHFTDRTTLPVEKQSQNQQPDSTNNASTEQPQDITTLPARLPENNPQGVQQPITAPQGTQQPQVTISQEMDTAEINQNREARELQKQRAQQRRERNRRIREQQAQQNVQDSVTPTQPQAQQPQELEYQFQQSAELPQYNRQIPQITQPQVKQPQQPEPQQQPHKRQQYNRQRPQVTQPQVQQPQLPEPQFQQSTERPQHNRRRVTQPQIEQQTQPQTSEAQPQIQPIQPYVVQSQTEQNEQQPVQSNQYPQHRVVQRARHAS